MTEKYYKEGWTCEECERLRGIIEKQEHSFNARDANRAKANVNLAKRLEAEQKENKELKLDKHVLELLCEGKDLSKDEKDSIICNLRSDIRDLEDGQDELNETNRNLYGVTAELKAENETLKKELDYWMKGTLKKENEALKK